MAKEVLPIKEDYLEEFIEILETGIKETEKEYEISERLKSSLITWIEEEREYVKRLNGE